MLEDKAIYMVFEYAEHDLLQIIHYHSTALRTPIPTAVLKSLMWQLVNGVAYLHANWILHRDLKPANILVTSNGVVKIGDLGLARLYSSSAPESVQWRQGGGDDLVPCARAAPRRTPLHDGD